MKLFIVPTPIGNLQDMTFRAINVLKSVDLILAEDTRVSGKLLKHFEINTRMQSYHMHNEHKILKSLVDKLKSGLEIALISCLLYTSPSPRDGLLSRMPSSA